MRWVMPLALFSLAASPNAHAAVDVRQSADKISVHAEAAPLAEVLDRLSKQLGMKVVYEGAPPRGTVSATLENRTPAQAVIGVLEGTGVDYLARMDASATRVDMLIVSSTGASAAAASAPRPAGSPALGRAAPPAEEEESDDDEDQAEEEPQPQPRRPGAANPNGEPDRPHPGAGAFQGRAGAPGMPVPPGPGPGGVLAPGNAAQQPYPVSPFAPVPPPPTTLPAPPPAAPQPGDDSEEE